MLILLLSARLAEILMPYLASAIIERTLRTFHLSSFTVHRSSNIFKIMEKPEIKDINYTGHWGKCYLVKYKGFSNVMLKEEINDWCKEVDQIKEELKSTES